MSQERLGKVCILILVGYSGMIMTELIAEG